MFDRRRILVTGAGGFIANRVIRELVGRDVEVVALEREVEASRQRSNFDALRSAGISFSMVHADMIELDLVGLLRTVDGVIHLAGSPGVESSWSKGFDHHVDNNVVATQRLFEAALDAPSTPIVVASSSSVYGSVTSGDAAEDRPLRPLSPYGASKAAMEMLVGAYTERGLRIVPLRYFTVFGPHQRPDMAMFRIIDAALRGVAFPLRGDGSQERSFTYVDDVARATVAALDLGVGQPINVGGDTSASLAEVMAIVEEITGRPVPCAPVPDMPGDPLRTSADTALARRVLGWEPTVGLRIGLERQIEWQMAMTSIVSGSTPARG